MKITLDTSNYGESVIALLTLALGDTGASKIAAQVLLSAHNGYFFQLNVASLCDLDSDNYQHAMNVIHGRSKTLTEPHNLVNKGDDIFQTLWDHWESSLHLNERFKTMCQDCYGKGKKSDSGGKFTDEDCWHCEGHGNTLPQGIRYTDGFAKPSH